MKKKIVAVGLLCCAIVASIFMIVFSADAESSARAYTQCGGLVEGADGKTTQTCTLKLDITGDPITFNEFMFTLSLNNLILREVTPLDNWYLENLTDTGFDLQTSLTTLSGSNDIAIVVLEKIDAASECGATMEFDWNRIDRTCSVFHDHYYDKNGANVTEAEYRKSCFGCTIDGDTYYNSDGYEVTYPEYLDSCSERPTCKEENGYFFNSSGEDVTEQEYRLDCFSCKRDGDTYYDKSEAKRS